MPNRIGLCLGMIALLAGCRPAITSTPAPAPRELAPPTTVPCPQPTPELFRVEPVFSPTSELQQMITVRIGNGEAVTVEVNGMAHVLTGEFSAFSAPANITVPLQANVPNTLKVSARVRLMDGPGGCKYGGYELRTERDRNGNPLIIEQRTASGNRDVPVASLTATPELPCLNPTPEQLSVEPVPASTNALTHTVRVRMGNADQFTVTVNGRAFNSRVGFVPVELEAGTANTITVVARTRVEDTGRCKIGGYELRTERDSIGKPLVIQQTRTANARQASVVITTPAPSAAPRVCADVAYDALIAKVTRPAALATLDSGACITLVYRSGDKVGARWVTAGSSFAPARTLYIRRGTELITVFTKNGRLMAREFLPGQKADDRELLREGNTLLLAASRTPVITDNGAAWLALVDIVARDR